MHALPLIQLDGHLFVTLVGQDWLLDTGAPTSFGTAAAVTIGDRSFSVPSSYMGLTVSQLREFVGHPALGTIGADLINEFDLLLDVSSEEAFFWRLSIFRGNRFIG